MDTWSRGVTTLGPRIAALATTFLVLAQLGAVLAHAGKIESAPAVTPAWTTFHLDNSRTGNDTTEPPVTSAVAQWESPALDGRPYAEPLVLGGTVYVATMNDTVYALSASTGALLWSNHVATAVAGTSVLCFADGPTVGIQSTPVIDPVAGILYAVGLVAPGNFILYALDLNNSGRLLFSRDVDPPAPFQPLAQAQRPALALANGMVYVAYGGHDCGTYHGYIVAARADNTETAPFVYEDQDSTMNGAPFWGASGPAVDSAGNLYAATGNGFSTTAYDHGESVVKLSQSLVEEDHWAPSNWAALNAADADLGSIGPSLLNGGLLFQGAKTGDGYLLNTASLGGTSAPPLFSAHICTGLTEDAIFGGTAYADPFIYVPCKNGLYALRLSGNTFSTAWSYTSGGPGYWAAPPIVAGGKVWDLDVGRGLLLGIDAQTGVARYEARVGSITHFSTPAAGGGRIFVAVNSSPDMASPHVDAFLMNPPEAATASLHLTSPYAVLNSINGTGGLVGPLAAARAFTFHVAGVGPVPANATSVVAQVFATGATGATTMSVWTSGLANPLVPVLNVPPSATVSGLVDVPLGAGGSLTVGNSTAPANVAVVVTGWRTPASTATGGRFLAEPPYRVLDTRNGTGHAGAIASGQTISIPVAGVGPVPASGAAAVSMDVTAISPAAAGSLTVWATGAAMPKAPSFEYTAGASQTGHVYSLLGAGGAVSIYNSGPAGVDVTSDTEGAFTAASAPAASTGLLVSTTLQPLATSIPALQTSGALAPGQTLTIQVSGWAGVPPSGASAVVLNLTAAGAASPGALTAWAGGSAVPPATELSYPSGAPAVNVVTVPISAAGTLAITNDGTAQVVIAATVEGWYSS